METKKLKLKAVFISEDGETFLCIRQYYLDDLCTGKFIDGRTFQGKKFKLISEVNNGRRKGVQI